MTVALKTSWQLPPKVLNGDISSDSIRNVGFKRQLSYLVLYNLFNYSFFKIKTSYKLP